MQPEISQDKQHLRNSPHSANDAEHCQEEVPQGQSVPKLESRTRLHVVLAEHDENHVHAYIVHADIPIFRHPLTPLFFGKIFLELEYIRIIWRAHGNVLHFCKLFNRQGSNFAHKFQGNAKFRSGPLAGRHTNNRAHGKSAPRPPRARLLKTADSQGRHCRGVSRHNEWGCQRGGFRTYLEHGNPCLEQPCLDHRLVLDITGMDSI